MATSDIDERSVTISGVKVIFPCKPYPSQFGMMDRVIKGLQRKQNALLESPTGSGKSLALLCSALAWQNAEYEKQAREGLQKSDSCGKPCQCAKNNKQKSVSPGSDDDVVTVSDDDDQDDDFKPVKTKKAQKEKRKHVSISYEEDDQSCGQCDCSCGVTASDSKKKTRVPKIYFGTRTHKQIAQITRELRKTAYHDVRMVILASREHTCIHPEVSRMKSKSEGCRERLDANGPGCKFNDRAKRVFLSQGQLQSELGTAWDLEDLTAACSNKKACPYFVTRNIIEQADIVFCPYNYLIDPLVRKNMDIKLSDQIIILDEAHNMEDCARDSASGSVTTDQITQAIHNIQELLEHHIKFADHLKIRNMLENLQQLVDSNSHSFEQTDYDSAYTVWSGLDIVVRLKNIGLGPENFKEYQHCFDSVMTSEEDEMIVRNRRNEVVRINSSTAKLLEQLFQILDYMYRDDLKFVQDYRLCIMRSMQFVSNRDTVDRWLGKNRRSGSRVMVYTLNFWCMNPAVAFSDFGVCRNVVLSSGTLSPMSSFSSELGSPFPIQLEASHVIEDKQVFVSGIGVGPSGAQLQAVYRNMETFQFQDELGNLILQVCNTVSHGVLCFLPSYRALQKFTERWKLTRLWHRISLRKRIFIEPRASDREEFDDMMKAFYDVVRGDIDSSYLSQDGDHAGDSSNIDGGLFFAVCRGKVSEGMDFADNNARAVITVGIPFPSIKDLQVKLKREYNDRYKSERGLLSGNEWYEIQAFRALNQALGRCIRHRKDWGALIMVDDRFVKSAGKYHKGLSRWVRSKVQTFTAFDEFQDSLKLFTEKMEEEMPPVNPDTSFIPCTPSTGRKDSSVYKRQSLDSPYMNNSGHSSPYFGSPPLNQNKQLTQTPITADKKTTFTSPKGSNSLPSPKGNNSLLSPKGSNSILSPKGNYPIFSPKGHHSLPASKGSHSPAVAAAPVIMPQVSSLSIQQQVLDIVNSPTSPKDQPYYVILNQGLPTQQTFLIEPNKMGEHTNQAPAVPNAAQPTSLLPATLLQSQGTNQLVLLQQPSTNLPTHFLQETNTANTLTSALPPTELGTSHPGNSINNTKGENINLAKGGNNKPQTKGGNPVTGQGENSKMIITLGESTLAPEDQLKQFLSTKLAPKDKAYYVIANKGKKSEATFFIEPNKKGKSKPKDQKDSKAKQEPLLKHEVTEPGSSSSTDTAQINPGARSDPSLPGSVTIGNTTSTTGNNKYLKFCNLPVTPVKTDIPVATITPQRQAMDNKQEQVATVSPELFDNKSQNPSLEQGHTGGDTKNKGSNSPTNTASAGVKKPLFKKKTSDVMSANSAQKDLISACNIGSSVKGEFCEEGAVILVNTNGEKDDAKPQAEDRLADAEDVNMRMADGEDFKESTGARNVRHTRAKGKMSSIEKLQQFRRKSRERDDVTETKTESKVDIDEQKKNIKSRLKDDSELDKMEGADEITKKRDDKQRGKTKVRQEKEGAEAGAVLQEVKGALNTDHVEEAGAEVAMEMEGDEDFLNTRRRGGRKRKSTARYMDWAKRSKKGVNNSDDEEGNDHENETKENLPSFQRHISCSKCGAKWMKSTDYEKRKRHPEFVSGQFKKNIELLYFPELKTDGSLLVPVVGDNSGVRLNSVYDLSQGVCVQYLRCKPCTDGPVVGVQVLLADKQSQYTAGQTWILSSAMKT